MKFDLETSEVGFTKIKSHNDTIDLCKVFLKMKDGEYSVGIAPQSVALRFAADAAEAVWRKA